MDETIRITGLAKSYGQNPVIRDISLSVAAGEVYGCLLYTSDTYNERENLLRKLLMYEECCGKQLEEMERYCCMVLVIEAEGSRRMAEAAAWMKEQGAYILSQKEGRCEAAVVLPSRLSVEMQGNYFLLRVRKLFEEEGTAVTLSLIHISSCPGRWYISS